MSTLRTSTSQKLSAVIVEYFEKFDKPDKKHESDEYVCGKWASEKGKSSIFWDCNTNRLSFEELVGDSGYLHGWLDRNSDGWQARLAFYDMDEEPWYSPSCGEEPEYVGDIHVRLLSETAIETQIKFSDDLDSSINTVTLRVNVTGEYLLPETVTHEPLCCPGDAVTAWCRDKESAKPATVTFVSDETLKADNSCRTVQYKHNAQSLRTFGLRNSDDAKDVHRAGANRLKKEKQTNEMTITSHNQDGGKLKRGCRTFAFSAMIKGRPCVKVMPGTCGQNRATSKRSVSFLKPSRTD